LEAAVLDLLADRNPAQARDFVVAYGERRNASWAEAARQAPERAASPIHLPQVRGQLRYHLGEIALAEAAGAASVGHLPMTTTFPGGVFTVARVGRFGLVSLVIRDKYRIPRRSVTRKLLAQRNIDLEPQTDMFDPQTGSRGATELAYFGCMVTIPWRRDPTVPADIAIAIPDSKLSQWLVWMPLHFAFAEFQQRVDAGKPQEPKRPDIPDNAFPKFRLPKRDESEDGKGV